MSKPQKLFIILFCCLAAFPTVLSLEALHSEILIFSLLMTWFIAAIIAGIITAIVKAMSKVS